MDLFRKEEFNLKYEEFLNMNGYDLMKNYFPEKKLFDEFKTFNRFIYISKISEIRFAYDYFIKNQKERHLTMAEVLDLRRDEFNRRYKLSSVLKETFLSYIIIFIFAGIWLIGSLPLTNPANYINNKEYTIGTYKDYRVDGLGSIKGPPSLIPSYSFEVNGITYEVEDFITYTNEQLMPREKKVVYDKHNPENSCIVTGNESTRNFRLIISCSIIGYVIITSIYKRYRWLY